MTARCEAQHVYLTESDLAFAEDIALLENYPIRAQAQMDELILNACMVGFEINVKKTEQIRLNQLDPSASAFAAKLSIDNQDIEVVEDFKYLCSFAGSTEHICGSSDHDLTITQANSEFQITVGSLEDHITDEVLYQRAGQECISEKVCKRQLSFTGHFLRMDPDEHIHRYLFYESAIEDNTRSGRPRHIDRSRHIFIQMNHLMIR